MVTKRPSKREKKNKKNFNREFDQESRYKVIQRSLVGVSNPTDAERLPKQVTSLKGCQQGYQKVASGS